MNGTVIQTSFPNPSLQVTADHNLKQVEAPVYPPKKGEVLLQVKATGICGYVRVSFSLSPRPFNFLHGVVWK
jgi:threonine dehydrogenase-like Zn-dependent dehydrogenase